MSYYSDAELKKIGLKEYGRNVKISRYSKIYRPESISIGDNVRIDDFVIMSAGEKGISIGRNVHVAVFCSLIGEEKITLDDFSGLSSRVSIYSSSDDYSGEFLTNPTVPKKYTGVSSKPVNIGKHCIIGAGSVILPGVNILEGTALGGMSLLSKSTDEWSIYFGNPAKKIKKRKRKLIDLECEYIKEPEQD